MARKTKEQKVEEAFLEEIQKDKLNEELRCVFADWLDEHGNHEEANKQRKYVSSVKLLQELAEKHADGIDSDGECDKEDLEYGERYASLMFFLRKQAAYDYEVEPYYIFTFDEYSEELWNAFEIVTGISSPVGSGRLRRPDFESSQYDDCRGCGDSFSGDDRSDECWGCG